MLLRISFILLLWAILGSPAWLEAQGLRKVHVAIPSISPSSIIFVIAKEKGYYREEGLDLDLIVMPAAVATQALIGGNVEFVGTGGAGLVPVLRGAPLQFLFITFYRPQYWLYAKPDIRSVEDLKGKRVGVSSIGSGPDSLLRDLLKKHGLEGGRDVTIMAIGAGTARFVALKAGVRRCHDADASGQLHGPGGWISGTRLLHRARSGGSAGEHLHAAGADKVRSDLD